MLTSSRPQVRFKCQNLTAFVNKWQGNEDVRRYYSMMQEVIIYLEREKLLLLEKRKKTCGPGSYNISVK